MYMYVCIYILYVASSEIWRMFVGHLGWHA